MLPARRTDSESMACFGTPRSPLNSLARHCITTNRNTHTIGVDTASGTSPCELLGMRCSHSTARARSWRQSLKGGCALTALCAHRQRNTQRRLCHGMECTCVYVKCAQSQVVFISSQCAVFGVSHWGSLARIACGCIVFVFAARHAVGTGPATCSSEWHEFFRIQNSQKQYIKSSVSPDVDSTNVGVCPRSVQAEA